MTERRAKQVAVLAVIGMYGAFVYALAMGASGRARDAVVALGCTLVAAIALDLSATAWSRSKAAALQTDGWPREIPRARAVAGLNLADRILSNEQSVGVCVRREWIGLAREAVGKDRE